ncbi:MAG TPA: UDP-N-acetylmuramate--L-alanine ligase [Candidatus Dormibacteraeota bacterium]|nr:UDP-N-acetylmuramate--L-alanine ligase [Candidatus Dormibacteraeota bacterium]
MRVHLMGIGGTGVSAIARVHLARGDEVSGCDLRESDVTYALEDAGARISIGHDPEHVLGCDRLIYGRATAQAGASEIEAGRAMGVEVLTHAEALAGMLAETDSIGVAGSAGKTTITHMIGTILASEGFDPTVLVGDGANVRTGSSRWLVAELDESDRSLVLHHPRRALVSNIDFDHADHYKDADDVASVFQTFLNGLPADGLAVVCADDPRAAALGSSARRVTYGFVDGADYRCGRERPFPIFHGGEELGRVNLRPPGWHNVQNATGAAAMALEAGVSFAGVRAGLEQFTGAHRRLEFIGVFQGAAVYDDYGHHPAKVRATLQAARELRHRRLIVVFQPHRYSRLAALLDDFARAFDGADRVLILDVYSAGEDNPTGISAGDLADQMPRGIYVGGFAEAREALEGLVGPDDLVLIMGAGDVREKLGDELAHKI